MAEIQCRGVRFTGIKAIVFDKDGTLSNSEPYLKLLGKWRSHFINTQVPEVGEQLLKAFGLHQTHLDPAGLLAVGTRRENEIAAATCVTQVGKAWFHALEIAHKAFQAADDSLQPKTLSTPPVAGITNLLQQAQAANFKLGILSSDTTKNVLDFVKLYELQSYFSACLGTDGALTKPDPALLSQICRQLEISPRETLIVGDALVDLEMAKAAGAGGCIGATWGWTSPPVLLGGDAIAQSVNEIVVVKI